MGLSERQSKILEFVKTFSRSNGYPPTIREIGKAVGISSTSVVNYNLDALQRNGHITRDRTVSRGIRLSGGLEEASRPMPGVIKVPLLGQIAAGVPIDVPENSHGGEQIDVPEDLLPVRDNVYALRVKGKSMIDAFIKRW
jgi:repressor LexA